MSDKIVFETEKTFDINKEVSDEFVFEVSKGMGDTIKNCFITIVSKEVPKVGTPNYKFSCDWKDDSLIKETVDRETVVENVKEDEWKVSSKTISYPFPILALRYTTVSILLKLNEPTFIKSVNVTFVGYENDTRRGIVISQHYWSPVMCHVYLLTNGTVYNPIRPREDNWCSIC